MDERARRPGGMRGSAGGLGFSGGPRAVVLGVEHPRAIAVIRSLGRGGIPVVAVDHDPSARGFYSRYIGEKRLIDADCEGALNALETLGKHGGGVLIPTNDHYLVLAARYFDRLSRSFVVATLPWDVLEPLMDKPQCYRLAREAGLRTPHVFTPGSVEELKRIVANLDLRDRAYILSVRLPGSQPVDVGTGRFTKVAGSDAASIERSCLEILSRTVELPMIAEVVPGESDRCVGVSMVVDRDSEPVLWYCVRRLQLYPYARSREFVHPYLLGANVYCESVHDDEAVEAATRFIRHVRFYGAITVEFRRDSRDGSLKLIKVDPRVVRATSLSTALGVDVPTALYRVFTGSEVKGPGSYVDGVAWIWPTWYAETLWRNRRRTPVQREVLTLLRNVGRIKAFAYLDVRDPAPFLVDLATAGRNWLRAGRKTAIKTFLPAESVAGKALRRLARRWAVSA